MSLVIGNGISIGNGITITIENQESPTNTSLPAITGTPRYRLTVNCSPGLWTPGVPGPITGYAYQWQDGIDDIPGATTNSYVIPLIVGHTLRCRVTVTNSVGATAVYTLDTDAVLANVPLAPTIGIATAGGSGSAIVNFTPNPDNGGALVTQYTAISDPGSIISTGLSSPITLTGLPSVTEYTNYTFKVSATNAIGASALSSPSNTVAVAHPSQLAPLSPDHISLGTGDTATNGGFSDNNQSSIWMSSDGTMVYQITHTDTTGLIAQIQRDPLTGLLTHISTINTTVKFGEITCTPDGLNMYVKGIVGGSTATTIHYRRNASTGVLTLTNTYTTIQAGEMDASGSVMYYTGTTGTTRYVYSVLINSTTGALAAGPTLVVTGLSTYLSWGADVKISPDGKFVHVLNNGTFAQSVAGSMYVYSRNTTTNALTLATFVTLTTDRTYTTMTMSNDGISLYLSNHRSTLQGSGRINLYSRNQVTGALTAQSYISLKSISSTDVNPPGPLVVSPDGASLYFTQISYKNTVNAVTNVYYEITEYARNTTTGLLTFFGDVDIPFVWGMSPEALFISPDGNNLYCQTYKYQSGHYNYIYQYSIG